MTKPHFFTKKPYKLPVFRSFLLFFFIALWWLLFSALTDRSNQPEPGEGNASRLLSAFNIHKYNELITDVVRPGDTFLGLLLRHGASRDAAISCYKSLTTLGLASLRPGDSLVMQRRLDGTVADFSLLHRLSCWYRVRMEGLDVKAEKKAASTMSLRCIVRGVLTSSLSEDMNDLGVDDACVSRFADLFAWNINFFTAPQKGDSFEMVFEKKYAENRFVGYGDILAARYVNAGHTFNAVGIRDDQGTMRYYDLDGKSLQSAFLKAPLKYNHISSGFTLHRLHPVLGIVRPHLGVDYAAPTGTPVFSPADGVVDFSGWMGGFGNHIRIMHGSSYETYYGHLSAIARNIRHGTRVSQGELIGYVGATGIATGPHLDYRISIDGRFVNPLDFSMPMNKGIAPQDASRFGALRQEFSTLFDTRLVNVSGCFVLDAGTINTDSAGAVPPAKSKG